MTIGRVTHRNGASLARHVICFARRTSIAAAFCATAACGPLPSSGPSAPSGPTALQIRGTTLLSPGSSGRLTAWLWTEDGQAREVPAAWAAEGDAISLASNGVVFARQRGSAIVHAHYGGHAGTETVHVVTNVAGTWRGSIKVLDCWIDRPMGVEPCEGRIGAIDPLVVNVTQSPTADNRDNLRAVVQVLTPPATGNFVGFVDSFGIVFFQGAVERPSDSLGFGFDLRWELKDDQLVPFTSNLNDTLDVQLATRSSMFSTHERWQLSTMTR